MKRIFRIFWTMPARDLVQIELEDAERQYLIACSHAEDWQARKRTLEGRIARLRKAAAAAQTRKEK